VHQVIFDEVHNLLSDIGDVWERLLLTCAAPVLALSATLGNADEFFKWYCK
jgi:superfamily II RNA helicase